MSDERDVVKESLVDRFQTLVDELLVRHHSVLDVLSKLTESESRINRAVTKSVTGCGCIQIQASRQQFFDDVPYDVLHQTVSSHILGQLCHKDRETIEEEMGQLLFYLTALANLLDISLYDTLVRKYNEANTLGRYYLS
ncbi:MAG: nucleoside triphosphate pyrophosphohydrolase family protein [Sulfobacillus sp.]